MALEKITFSEKFVLLDNEGTMCSLSILKPLFDYFYSTLRQYLDDHWQDSEVQKIIGMLKKQYLEDVSNEVPGLVPIVEGSLEKESIYNNIMWHSKLSRDSTAFKIIRKVQNLIWIYGLQTNPCLKFKVFDDVVPSLKLWSKSNKIISTYSSGPTEVQKLAYNKVDDGEFLKLLSYCFDLEMGVKTESSSYLNIASKLGCSASDILFITDMIAEADAASKAGCRVLLSLRPGNAPISEEDRSRFVCITSFDELIPNGAA